MNLHEYKCKELLAARGIRIPKGSVCYDSLEALIAARRLKSEKVVLKAQVHSGGRGKAGGVAVVPVDDDLRKKARDILGMTLVTNQTGPQGKPVSCLLVEEVVPIDKEIYVGVVLDRITGRVTIMGSREGGTEIEQLARDAPDKIKTTSINPARGLHVYQARSMAYRLVWQDECPNVNDIIGQLMKVITVLYEIFIEFDCTLVEINPLVVSAGKVLALDAKINLDDNALFRHPEMEDVRDRTQEEPLEMSARKDGLSYIRLDGDIGCVVNGAGLAMATLDLIAHHGGGPANFLDVGGGASEQVVGDAMELLLDDPNVRVVFVNIFGGILRCDVLARGVIKSLKRHHVELPVVVRIEGTNIEEGRRLFKESGLPIKMIPSLDEAAKLVVEKARSLVA